MHSQYILWRENYVRGALCSLLPGEFYDYAHRSRVGAQYISVTGHGADHNQGFREEEKQSRQMSLRAFLVGH